MQYTVQSAVQRCLGLVLFSPASHRVGDRRKSRPTSLETLVDVTGRFLHRGIGVGSLGSRYGCLLRMTMVMMKSSEDDDGAGLELGNGQPYELSDEQLWVQFSLS